MATPASPNSISLNNVNTELGLSATATITMNNPAVRSLAGKPTNTSQISMSDLRGKSNILIITSPANTVLYDVNVRTVLINSGWDQSTSVVYVISPTTYIVSTSTATAALTVSGSFPNGATIINNGYVMGKGGKGGAGGEPSSGGGSGGGGNGSPGGPALRATSAMTLTNNGTIGGGGGGGGGGNGWSGGYQYSGGATGGGGRAFGPSGDPYIGEYGPQAAGYGASGTLTAPGNGAPRVFPAGASGAGGNLGQSGAGGEGITDGAGFYHPPSFGGAAGPAIVGNNLITYSVRGNILGAYT